MARHDEGIESAPRVERPARLVRRAPDEEPAFEPGPSGATETVSAGALAHPPGGDEKEPPAGPDKEQPGP